MKEFFNIELTDEEFDFLICEQNKGKELKVVDGKVVAVEYVPSDKEIAENRISELKKMLEDTDYIANKLTEAIAEYVVTQNIEPVNALRSLYAGQLAQRQAWRDEINKLQGENEL